MSTYHPISKSCGDHRDNFAEFKPFDPINNCKSAGIIPYAIHNQTLYFLFQRSKNPGKKKDAGWNDFGGKRISLAETTAETASREFSEETSCLFYLRDQIDDLSKKYYELLKDNKNLYYDESTVDILKSIIPLSQKYFNDKITEFVLPIHVSSKEIYISYLVKVTYIDERDLPHAEDIHIDYEDRYLRDCKWLSFEELMTMDEKEFHKRLQITRIQQRINSYYQKELF